MISAYIESTSIGSRNRGDKCGHRAAIEVKLSQGYQISSKERDCLYACSGIADPNCEGGTSLKDLRDFDEIFHRHLF